MKSGDYQTSGRRNAYRAMVQVDEHLQAGVPHIWALGDVTGGLQFPYTSLDDFRY